MNKKSDKVGNNIYRLLRLSRDITAVELSKELEISPAYIHAIETGEREPSDELKQKYLKALSIDENIFDTLSKKMKKTNSFEKLMFLLLKLIVKSEPEL